MVWRASVETDFVIDGVAITVGDHRDNGMYVAGPVGRMDLDLVHVPSGCRIDDPTMRLPSDLAHTLYDALASHYGGAADVRQLRADLEAERARCDILIGHLANLSAAAIRRE